MQRVALTVLATLLSAPLGAAQEPPASPSVATAPASSPIVLDGSLDELAWTEAGDTPTLTPQVRERGRATPIYATHISRLTDGVSLSVGIVCPVTEPEKIAVHTLQRDADMAGDDTLALVLDTFRDGRTGY